ncbi:MAG: protein jag [Firmicutes bacterium]|nr:protein jag [Bacillota bacterium]
MLPLQQYPPADPATAAGVAQEFLVHVTKLMNLEVSVEAGVDDEGNVRVNIHGDTLGILIGRRGETLDALQYLTSLNVNHGKDEYTRVTLDTENYRAKREEALKRLANRMANRAVKTGRKVVLEPMNPYERRILHSALQQNDAVTTHSEGDEPNRHIVISLKS